MSVSRIAAPATMMSARAGASPGTARRSSAVIARRRFATARRSLRVSGSSRPGTRPWSSRAATAARFTMVPEVP